nr:MAG TPA: hypothetical protein [Caudoviricetes sp.]DAN44653.1 MAG TPA: hypothetical protein [Caudoviricetes sp.]
MKKSLLFYSEITFREIAWILNPTFPEQTKKPQAIACGYNSNNILEIFLSVLKKLFCSNN